MKLFQRCSIPLLNAAPPLCAHKVVAQLLHLRAHTRLHLFARHLRREGAAAKARTDEPSSNFHVLMVFAVALT
jgi:hypothetical protein